MIMNNIKNYNKIIENISYHLKKINFHIFGIYNICFCRPQSPNNYECWVH